jgi:energy-coupling factor transporter ATP-binding protein EcfA2
VRLISLEEHAVALVEAEQVSYRYTGNGLGLDGISLTVEPGELVLVTGPSGCGKSTLARCLTGLIPHLYRGALAGMIGAPMGFVALGLVRSILGYIVFGALGGLLGGLTLAALRRAGFFAYLAERR